MEPAKEPGTVPLKSKRDYSGIYMPSDRIGAGHLHIAAANTLLTLADKEPWKEIEAELCDHRRCPYRRDEGITS